MTIGVFDSGVGGLTIHRALVDAFPDDDFIYLADQAHVPYGGRDGGEIVALTKAACERLFGEGCGLVILACNTASAVALRRLQQTWLPVYRAALGRPVNILGIIVPTIEAATGVAWGGKAGEPGASSQHLGSLAIFCTRATAAAQVYEVEIAKTGSRIEVFSEPCAHLAGMIEAGAAAADLTATVSMHIAAVTERIGRAPDRAILGSTHYEVIADIFRRCLPPGTALIHQPPATAMALRVYLRQHPEYRRLGSGSRRYLTTGQPGARHRLVETFWGGPLEFEAA